MRRYAVGEQNDGNSQNTPFVATTWSTKLPSASQGQRARAVQWQIEVPVPPLMLTPPVQLELSRRGVALGQRKLCADPPPWSHQTGAAELAPAPPVRAPTVHRAGLMRPGAVDQARRQVAIQALPVGMAQLSTQREEVPAIAQLGDRIGWNGGAV